MSLGQGGYVTVELGEPAVDGPGPDVRVFQTTSQRAGDRSTPPRAARARSSSLGLRRSCGERTPGVFSNHCDFDLRDGGLAAARYLKVEDGEIYPCLAGGTLTEGADIDAVADPEPMSPFEVRPDSCSPPRSAVSLALLAYLFSTTDLDALQARASAPATPSSSPWPWPSTALILAISTWRWRVLLQAQGYRAPLRHLSGSYLVATFFNNFLPSNIGGDVIRVRDSCAPHRLHHHLAGRGRHRPHPRASARSTCWPWAPTWPAAPRVRGLAGARPALLALGVVFGVARLRLLPARHRAARDGRAWA